MRLYRALTEVRPNWGGRLVLTCGPGCASTGAPSAVSIAGGTTLAIDPEPAAGKAALRAGYLDFLVNSLDEALRALKNEVRQHRPIAVGLTALVEPTVAEMVARGVQPDLYLAAKQLNNPELATLAARGMPALTPEPAAPDEHLLTPATNATLREVEAALLALLPDPDPRRPWIQRAPQYLREARTGGRCIWLAEHEFGSLRQQGIVLAPAAV